MSEIQAYDDPIPNDGAGFDPSFVTPPEREAEEREAKSKIASSYPVLNDLIKDFEVDIAKADSISGGDLYNLAESTPQQAQIKFAANKMYVDNLRTKLEAIKLMRDSHKR